MGHGVGGIEGMWQTSCRSEPVRSVSPLVRGWVVRGSGHLPWFLRPCLACGFVLSCPPELGLVGTTDKDCESRLRWSWWALVPSRVAGRDRAAARSEGGQGGGCPPFWASWSRLCSQ